MQGIGSMAPMDLLTNPSSQIKGRSGAPADSSQSQKNMPSFDRSLATAEKESQPVREENLPTDGKMENAPTRGKTSSAPVPTEQKVTSGSATDGGTEEADIEKETRNFFNTNSVEKFDQQIVLQNVRKKEAMLKFMDSMESELGVSPEAMIEAMKALGDVEGQKPPIGTMAKVLANLDLEGDQVDRAAELYGNFLSEMSQGRQKPDLESVKMEVTRLQDPRFMAQQEKVDSRRAAIDRITAGFIGEEILRRNADMAAPMKSPRELQKEQAMMKVIDQFNNVPRPVKAPLESVYSPNQMSSGEMTEVLSRLQSGQADFSEFAPKVMNYSADSGTGGHRLSQNLSTDSADSFFGVEDQGSFGQSSTMNLQSGADFGAMDSDLSGQESSEELEALGDEGIDSRFALHQTSRTPEGPQSLQKLVSLNANVSENGIDNMKDIVDQAQVMVRKGGGEMKIQLNPDNLGQIDLKVDVQDGKVNIQMTTDSPEAKKLIEGQLSDLKHGLSSHKLSVDHIKVDVSSELAKDFQNQRQDEAQKDFAREFARDFLGSRREQGGGFAQQEFASSPFQKYFQQSRREIEPLSMGEPSSVTKKNHKGNLNLVA